jgi:hypothetical protein
MEHKLTRIPVESFPILRNLFKVDWPKHIISYATVQTHIKKIENDFDCQQNFEILSLNDFWTRDATFIIHVTVSHMFYL